MARTIDRPGAPAQGAGMRAVVRLAFAAALLLPQAAGAQVLPHRAAYALRLGAAANAPKIGTAVQDLTLDCAGWHLKRDIATEIAVTASWKINVASKLEGEESRGGGAFRYRTLQTQNGSERETRGRVQRTGGETRADIVSPSGPTQFVLPPPTLMPVAAMDHLIERLRAGATTFPALTFDAEVISDAFLVDVTELNPGMIRGARPVDRPVAMPVGQSWPVFMTFTRGRKQDQKPLFSVNALIFESGVLDRLTVDTGILAVTADLQTLQMHKPPICPRS
jgi:hypothetical protein